MVLLHHKDRALAGATVLVARGLAGLAEVALGVILLQGHGGLSWTGRSLWASRIDGGGRAGSRRLIPCRTYQRRGSAVRCSNSHAVLDGPYCGEANPVCTRPG